MASKEVKNELKSARDSIQNKDYHAALKHCKAVLKLDKTNYNAFVFVGVASIELGKAEQAQAAYKKAIEINPDNILAWQGLASLHEKEPEFGNKHEFVEVYQRLMKHYESSDKTKWSDVVLKLADLHKSLTNVDEAFKLLKLLQDKDGEIDQNLLWCKLVALLQGNKGILNTVQKNELVNVYKTILHGSTEASDETRQYFQDYLNLLLEDTTIPVEDIISEAKRMIDAFGKDEFTLNILAKLYLKQLVEVNDEEVMIYEELLALDPESSLALLGLGKVKVFQKDFTQAETLLKNGLQYLATSPLGWYFLSQSQLSRHQYEDAFNSSVKGLECMKNDSSLSESDLVFFELSLCRAKSCCKLGKEGVTEAVALLNELSTLQPNNLDVHVQLGRIYVRANMLAEAKKCLANAQDIEKASCQCCILEGEIFVHEDHLKNAETSFLRGIELQEDVADCYLNLGQLYWKMEGERRTEKNKCLECLIKAAKLDPYNSSTFLYLGYYYEIVGLDDNKALRLYKKAHELNPFCDEAGEALGDAYMKLGREDEAAELCRKFTGNAGIRRVKWAFLRLGLYYLKNQQHNDAVHCFTDALRVDEDDANAWECLGEAYMSRGSYSPALASFTRATELNPSLLYSQYQIAVVKHLLGLFEEAVLVYKSILDEHRDYVPALKGLGETYISYARSSLHEDFHGRAVDYIQNAIIVLARAVECDGHLSCLWKLLGDASSLVFNIHEDNVRIELPESLRNFMNFEEVHVSKMELLGLAASSFARAARYNPSCASLWHDVGLGNFRMSTIHKDRSERQRLCERSMKALKKGLNMEPSNYNIWNTLGIVAASSDVSNPELSQHSFIQSIQSQKNAVAWVNLGVLYLRHGKADMANRAFSAAQCTDPSYTQAWIGQATIAEMFAHHEAMDLYRHSHELGTHVEGYLGYAHWVCQTILSIPNGKTSCILKGKPYADLSHLPHKLRSIVLIASVALDKYTGQIQDDPCAFNMHGVLLEHQELYSQAEKAYKCSLQLLENSENSDEECCKIVRANYARVLCSLAKYSESVKVYQEIKPLTNFYHQTGLALALLMLGNLQQSYQAYEQAFELAADGGQKSHVRAAMGMLGYISGDIDGCKFALCESSELQPSSDQGLLALSALGSITSDLTLAATALSVLVKIGQKVGDESLIAEASYLFASFYALQGSPDIGKSYIIKEIHCRPHSSLLWNNLAKFILRFQPNKLKAAGSCADAAHTLGDRNVEDVSTTCAYSSIGSGHDQLFGKSYSNKFPPGVVSAQKAVHMRPDCLANWSLLSAALTDASNYGAPQKTKLCELVTHFSLTKAIEASNRPASKPDVFERKNVNIVEESQKWLALHYGYCLYYSGKMDEAIQHCRQALELWGVDSSFSTRVKLLLVEINSCVFEYSACLQDVTTVLTANRDDCYAWLFSALFHEQHGLIQAAEFCYKNCLDLATRKSLLHGKTVSVVRLAHLALRKSMIQDVSTRCNELRIPVACLELLQNCSTKFLLLGMASYLQNFIRQGKDLLRKVNSVDASSKDVANFYLVLLNLKKPEKGETLHDAVEKASSESLGGALQDILLYCMAMNFDGLMKKRLLMKCVHLNPSEIRFWNALRDL